VRIKTTSFYAQHGLTLYFANQVVTSPGGQGFTIPHKDNQGFTSISDVVLEVVNRLNGAGACFASVGQIDVWNSVVNAPNTFMGYEIPKQPTTPIGATPRIASSYLMYIFAAQNRQKARLTAFEYITASPQRFSPDTIPVSDDGSVAWYVLNSSIPFATQDGLPLTNLVSINVGYNRKLARSYGRAITP
jgi:hypothetical protein